MVGWSNQPTLVVKNLLLSGKSKLKVCNPFVEGQY